MGNMSEKDKDMTIISSELMEIVIDPVYAEVKDELVLLLARLKKGDIELTADQLLAQLTELKARCTGRGR